MNNPSLETFIPDRYGKGSSIAGAGLIFSYIIYGYGK
jgi:hypothetical protein